MQPCIFLNLCIKQRVSRGNVQDGHQCARATRDPISWNNILIFWGFLLPEAWPWIRWPFVLLPRLLQLRCHMKMNPRSTKRQGEDNNSIDSKFA